jgi:hypothetical protein
MVALASILYDTRVGRGGASCTTSQSLRGNIKKLIPLEVCYTTAEMKQKKSGKIGRRI